MNPNISNLFSRIGSALRSNRGRDVLTYLMFVAVAFVFWVFMSLDSEVQREFDVPLEITETPDSVTLIGHLPPTLTVSVKGKDSQLLRFLWGNPPTIRFKWNDNISDRRLFIPATRLDTRLREYFGSGVDLVACRPDSLAIPYTTMPGVKVPLKVQADIKTNLQYIVSGPLHADVDSVTLYSESGIPHSLQYVSTEPLITSGLKDTTRFEIKIKPIIGVRIIPDRVNVTVPVEPLISRKRTVVIEPQGVPAGKHLVTFPSRVEVSYLVPMSSYNEELPVKAFVEYADVHNPGNKIPVTLSMLPSIYHSVSVSPDMVEYIIEDAQ